MSGPAKLDRQTLRSVLQKWPFLSMNSDVSIEMFDFKETNQWLVFLSMGLKIVGLQLVVFVLALGLR